MPCGRPSKCSYSQPAVTAITVRATYAIAPWLLLLRAACCLDARMNSQAPPRWSVCATAVLATALAYALSTGANEIWPLAWIAPIPILALAFIASARTTLVTAFLAYLLGLGGHLPTVGAAAPLFLVLLGFTVTALAFAIVVRITRAAVLQFDHWATVFVFPVLLTTWDHFWPYVRLPYSQTKFLS